MKPEPRTNEKYGSLICTSECECFNSVTQRCGFELEDKSIIMISVGSFCSHKVIELLQTRDLYNKTLELFEGAHIHLSDGVLGELSVMELVGKMNELIGDRLQFQLTDGKTIRRGYKA